MKDEFEVGVPIPDGTIVGIEHLSVDTAKKTLGVWTCPSDKEIISLQKMRDKAQEWLDRAKEGRMMR